MFLQPFRAGMPLDHIPLQFGDERGRHGSGPSDAEITDELLIKANQLIDRYVRPALAGDGGGLEVVGIEEKTISVRYQGACGTCPSATAQTLRAIENLLRTQLDPEINLVSA